MQEDIELLEDAIRRLKQWTEPTIDAVNALRWLNELLEIKKNAVQANYIDDTKCGEIRGK